MSVIYTVSDGDVAVAADLNQLVNALLNQFTLTDTTQIALGRLVIPRVLAVDAPGSPTTGQTWFVTDEGVDGRLYIRHASDDVVYLPLRQFVKSAEITVTDISSTSYVDVGLSVSITTSGGRLKIYMLPGVTGLTAQAGIILFSGGSDNTLSGKIKAVVGAQNLDSQGVQLSANSAIMDQLDIPSSAFVWGYTPAAGSYTVKLQALVGSPSQLRFQAGLTLCVEEWGT